MISTKIDLKDKFTNLGCRIIIRNQNYIL